MYTPEPDDVYLAANAYLPYLPEEMQESLLSLLADAKIGKKTDDQVLELLAQNDQAREWIRAALFIDADRTLSPEYTPLGGSVQAISARKWKCTKCDFVWFIYRSGQPVPPCPKDWSILKPVVDEIRK
jgi:hypothetical protein